MTTILGFHISLIRPSHHHTTIYKDELPYARRQARTKTIKEHCGKVTICCVMLKSGGVRGIPVPATHIKVLETFNIQPEEVVKTGWELENGNYLWR